MRAKSSGVLIVLDPNLISRSFTFYSTVAKLMMRFILGTPFVPNTVIVLPDEVPDILAAIPEWFIEDIADFLTITIR